jgi:hypothetical protein
VGSIRRSPLTTATDYGIFQVAPPNWELNCAWNLLPGEARV